MPFPIDDKFIVATENKLGVKFPKEFRRGMREVNGGEVDIEGDDWRLFPIFDTSDKKHLKRTCGDIVRETASAREWTGFPTFGVALGTNDCGDFLVMLPLKNDPLMLEQTVYLWDHETGELQVVFPMVEILMNSRS